MCVYREDLSLSCVEFYDSFCRYVTGEYLFFLYFSTVTCIYVYISGTSLDVYLKEGGEGGSKRFLIIDQLSVTMIYR